MVPTVPREEGDRAATNLSDRDRIRRRTVRRVDDVLRRSVQKGVKAGSANHPDIGPYGHAETLPGESCAGRSVTRCPVIAGTPRMILERMWELKESYRPQGFFPHVYFGGMPQDEALKNMHLFAEKVLPELKSWEAETSIDDRFLEAAE